MSPLTDVLRAAAKRYRADVETLLADCDAELHSLIATLVTRKDYERALTDFGTVINQKPQAIEGYEARAAVYETKKDYGKAIEDRNQVIRLKPRDPWKHVRVDVDIAAH